MNTLFESADHFTRTLNDRFEPRVKTHLKHVYSTLTATILSASLGAYLHLYTNLAATLRPIIQHSVQNIESVINSNSGSATESLLPPKWPTFSAIQRKPTSWSCKPRLLTAVAAAAEDKNEKVPAGTRVAKTAGGPGKRSIATSYN
ncbi:Bax inhibitor 1 [Tyrophagus putrescentiae]|nr:Bax inhibitor 1 [Tyrophagus putrescentiae]